MSHGGSDFVREVDILLGQKDAQWFNDNSARKLKYGQIVFLVSTGQYKLGNGTSTLAALTWYGGAVSSTWATITGTPSDSAALVAYLTGNYEQLSNKGIANGYAPLDAGGKIPANHLPSTVMQYQGQWDASTNTPALIDGTGDAGDIYEVIVAGTHDFGSGSITFKVGDWAVYDGTIWEKSVNSNEVVSVNGLTGAVNLIANSILLSGYVGPSAGTVNATDTVHTAIGKLDGNIQAMNTIITTIVTSATPTPVLSSNNKTDQLIVTGLNVNAVLAVPTGAAPTDGKMVIVVITATGADRTIGYNAIYSNPPSMTLPTSVINNTTTILGFRWFASLSKYILIAKGTNIV